MYKVPDLNSALRVAYRNPHTYTVQTDEAFEPDRTKIVRETKSNVKERLYDNISGQLISTSTEPHRKNCKILSNNEGDIIILGEKVGKSRKVEKNTVRNLEEFVSFIKPKMKALHGI